MYFSFNCATNFPSIQALLQAELEENISGFDISIPTAGEQISYNFAQTFTTAFIAMLGTQVIVAKSVSTVLSCLLVVLWHLVASQIYLGKFISRRRYRTFKESCYKSIWFNITQSFMIMTCIYRIYSVWTLDNTRHTNLSFNHLLSCYTFWIRTDTCN